MGLKFAAFNMLRVLGVDVLDPDALAQAIQTAALNKLAFEASIGNAVLNITEKEDCDSPNSYKHTRYGS